MAKQTISRRTYTKDSFVDDTVTVDNDRPPEPLEVSCTNELSEISADVVVPLIEFPSPTNYTLREVYGFLRDPATGQAFEFDVKVNGTTIFSTLPTIDAGEEDTDTAATPQVLSESSIAERDLVQVFCTQAGSTFGGAGFKVIFKPVG